MEQTAIEILKTYGIWLGLFVLMAIVVILNFPKILEIIKKRQEIKEKNVCKNGEILAQLTTLVTEEQTTLRNEINVKLESIYKTNEVQREDIQSSKQERKLMIKGLIALCKRMEETGANGTVSHTREELEEYIFEMSHK